MEGFKFDSPHNLTGTHPNRSFIASTIPCSRFENNLHCYVYNFVLYCFFTFYFYSFELSVDIFDYMDALVELEKRSKSDYF